MYSLIDVAPTIASILHVSLPKTDGVPIPAIVRDLNDYNKLILIIVDGLGLNLYEIFKHYFNFNGMVIGCKGVSMHTTPAIATILTGLYPHNHGVFETRHAYTSDPISVVELASIQGIISAVIMEKIGAKLFRVDQVVEIEEEDAIKYDHQIKNALIEAAQKSVFTVAHFRILDRFYHDNKNIEEAVEILSMNLKDVIICSKDTGIMICGGFCRYYHKFFTTSKSNISLRLFQSGIRAPNIL
jgi:hypothetical protein